MTEENKENNLIRLGGLWANEKGNLSGNLSASARIIIIPNKWKKTDKHPDYLMLLAPNERKEQESGESAQGFAPTPISNEQQPPSDMPEPPPISDSDVPF